MIFVIHAGEMFVMTYDLTIVDIRVGWVNIYR